MACSPWPATAPPAAQTGVGVHLYAANRDMRGRYFYDADGELLIVPQLGRLRLDTKFLVEVEVHEIAVIPRGVRFERVVARRPGARLRVRNLGALLRLHLGPIGSGPAPRDFLAPHASYEDVEPPAELAELPGPPCGRIGHSPLTRSPGMQLRPKYDLRHFIIGSISFDHPDPSMSWSCTRPATARPATWTS